VVVGGDRQFVAGPAGGLAREQVGLAQEVRHERGGGQVVQLGGRAELLDLAGVHHGDRVGHRHGLLLVVGDVHERDADLGLDPLQLDLHPPAQGQVQRAERLVEQQHLRVVDQRAGQRDPLLLAAGELGGTAPAVPVELDQGEHPLDLGGDLALAPTTQAKGDIFVHVEVGKERIALEDGVDGPVVRPQPGDVLGTEQHPARRGLVQSGDHPQRGGLAAAGRPEQREERAGRDDEAEVVDRRDGAEPLRHPVKLEIRQSGAP
jgi:hypothetical protein